MGSAKFHRDDPLLTHPCLIGIKKLSQVPFGSGLPICPRLSMSAGFCSLSQCDPACHEMLPRAIGIIHASAPRVNKGYSQPVGRSMTVVRSHAFLPFQSMGILHEAGLHLKKKLSRLVMSLPADRLKKIASCFQLVEALENKQTGPWLLPFARLTSQPKKKKKSCMAHLLFEFAFAIAQS
ncbi:hypothetical protein DM01DRAFT_1069669 [Hesseltinella vesiculosa]|uniref:Uncharacterized protein n=1 Tax=Hesseltinella vesiculosa TaxID=101127 RepID=A0A1X2GWI9_9FUNG|nr:hypothetical protein DM01DRAFT_1069669 [Hesseltinella vesiculosa]